MEIVWLPGSFPDMESHTFTTVIYFDLAKTWIRYCLPNVRKTSGWPCVGHTWVAIPNPNDFSNDRFLNKCLENMWLSVHLPHLCDTLPCAIQTLTRLRKSVAKTDRVRLWPIAGSPHHVNFKLRTLRNSV